MEKNIEETNNKPEKGFSNQFAKTLNILEQFSIVERRVNRGSLDRPENDVEHGYDLAIIAMGIVQNDNLPLEIGKVIRYALVHDLVEVYANDTFALDASAQVGKDEREKLALTMIAGDSSINFLVKDIEEYEALASEEAKFVYALDKVLPAVGIINGQQSLYKDNGFSQSDWENLFITKICASKYVTPYLNQVIALQKQNLHLFAEEKQ